MKFPRLLSPHCPPIRSSRTASRTTRGHQRSVATSVVPGNRGDQDPSARLTSSECLSPKYLLHGRSYLEANLLLPGRQDRSLHRPHLPVFPSRPARPRSKGLRRRSLKDSASCQSSSTISPFLKVIRCETSVPVPSSREVPRRAHWLARASS